MNSIIMPVFNNLEMTEDCIRTVIKTTPPCEIIVVDNGSEPAFRWGFVQGHEVRVIRNIENKGFPVAVNQGIREAKGDVIILLNNDVAVTPGWAKKLTSPLSDYAITSPVTNFAAGMQQVAVTPYQNIEELNQSAQEWAENYGDEIQDVNFVIGFCMAFRKSLFEEIGEFDESLWPCSGEEIDFCLKAKEAGHKVGIVTGCYVHHEGSQTFKEMGFINKKYTDLCKRNDDHLAEKWGAGFWDRQDVNYKPENKKTITVGDHTYGAENMSVFFQDEANLIIGKYCSIGPKLTVYLGGEHRTEWISTYPFSEFHPEIKGYDYRISKGDVTIGNDVWIGHGVTILSGVTIGDGAVIGAGSVVASNVLPYSIVAGNPAKLIKYRMKESIIEWWDWPEDVIYEAIPLLQSDNYEGLLQFAKEKGLYED